MSDDALVTFGAPVAANALSFTDAGFMPITQATLGGNALSLPSGFDGFYLGYSGAGTETFASALAPNAPPPAPVSADYQQLNYQIFGYRGTAVFGNDQHGNATVTGITSQTQVATGSLIAGHLDFAPDGSSKGYVDVSVVVGNKTVGQLNVAEQHAATDIGFVSQNSITLHGGSLIGTFVPVSA